MMDWLLNAVFTMLGVLAAIGTRRRRRPAIWLALGRVLGDNALRRSA